MRFTLESGVIAIEFQQDGLKERIEKVLSEILSDKHECIVKLHFEKRGDENGNLQRTCNPNPACSHGKHC